ncbi:hypothetical protein TNCV_1139811 [Trichonephila clavipes]|nr:hypothetical protein TNCV_1139811 [Trichonephila clavipes]
MWPWLPSGQGMGSWLACHEFEPSTTKEPPCNELYVFGGMRSNEFKATDDVEVFNADTHTSRKGISLPAFITGTSALFLPKQSTVLSAIGQIRDANQVLSPLIAVGLNPPSYREV